MMRMPRSRAACAHRGPLLEEQRTARTPPRARRGRARAEPSRAPPASRSTSGRSQAFHAAPPCARFSADEEREVGEPRGVAGARRRRRGSRLAASACFWNASAAFASSGRRCSPTRPKSTASCGKAGPARARPPRAAPARRADRARPGAGCRRTPRRTSTASRRSRSGPSGSTCQSDWPVSWRKSTNAIASGPSSPMPYGPGQRRGMEQDAGDARGRHGPAIPP